MNTLIKGGVKMAVKDSNQLAAFLNNGWTVVTEEAPQEKATVEDAAEKKQNTKTKPVK